jgi:protein ImuB
MYACIHSPDAGELARNFSPWIEMVDDRTAVFTITPRQLREDSLRRMPQAQVAVAGTAEAAILAARHFPGFTFLEPGDEARVLGSLSIDCLPPDPVIFRALFSWGVHTLGHLARLPEKGIAERLGPRGIELQRLARGALNRPLRPLIPASKYEALAELDFPLDRLEPLIFLLGQFLHDLTRRLESQSLAAAELHLTLNKKQRVLRLPFPTRDVKFLLKLLEHELEAHKADEPVERVHLLIEPVDPRRIQHDLFTLAAPEPEKLELTLGKIRGLVGGQNVKVPEIRDTYRPGWGEAEQRLAFRYFHPPLEAQVETQAGAPRRLRAANLRGVRVHGMVIRAAGPWRSSGEWWRPDAWDRDEWDIFLSNETRDEGALYRLCRTRATGAWFVEGAYD